MDCLSDSPAHASMHSSSPEKIAGKLQLPELHADPGLEIGDDAQKLLSWDDCDCDCD
jgi:hypothetical protein